MDSKHPFKNRRGWVVALLAVPLLLAGYVLSIGPAYTLLLTTRPRAGSFSTEVYRTAYAPLIWCSQRSPAFYRWMDRYCGWWAGTLA